MTIARLITMPASNFSEKARWALDYTGIPYVEERHAYFLHKLPVRRAGGKGTVPVLVTDDGVYPESDDILAWADRNPAAAARLFPDDDEKRRQVEELVALCGDTMGKASGPWLTCHVMANTALAKRVVADGVPKWQRAVLPAFMPVGRLLMRRRRDVTSDGLAKARRDVSAALDVIAERLSDGRPYLVGDHFTAADLTFAALSALVLMPAKFGGTPLVPAEFPDGRADVEAWREHPAGRFVMDMYEKHR